MIYEIAVLPVKSDKLDSFVRAFRAVAHFLSRAKGYRGHRLMQGIENPSDFHLIVRWQTLEHHTEEFEPSSDHEHFMAALQEFFVAEPAVQHVRIAREPESLLCDGSGMVSRRTG